MLTISLGVATAPADGKSLEELLRAADVALYSAKASGRNRTVTRGDAELASAWTGATLPLAAPDFGQPA